jgi:hypothetical protein
MREMLALLHYSLATSVNRRGYHRISQFLSFQTRRAFPQEVNLLFLTREDRSDILFKVNIISGNIAFHSKTKSCTAIIMDKNTMHIVASNLTVAYFSKPGTSVTVSKVQNMGPFKTDQKLGVFAVYQGFLDMLKEENKKE